jgi:hypothetical protein
VGDEIQPLRIAALGGPIDSVQKDVPGNRRDDLIRLPVINGDQRPATLERLDELRAVNWVNEGS